MNPQLALLLVSALWGTTFVLVKSGLADASPFVFLALRFAVASLISLLIWRKHRPEGGAWARGIPLGLVLAAAYGSQTIGLTWTSPSRSAFVTGLNVALVPIWGAILLSQRPRILPLIGLAITLAGLTLLMSPKGGSWNIGDTWTIACAILFALHVALLSRWGDRFSTESLLTSQLVVTSLAAFIAIPLEEARFTWTPRLGLALFVTGIFATAGTTWLQLRYQPRVTATETALLYATEPLFAAIFSYFMIGERMTATAISGGILIIAGALLGQVGHRTAA
jgi:drug/metabolite transporter (DMT)-like permease